jgi:Fibronectin type III domain
MRKLNFKFQNIFLLTIGLIFAGSVSAQAAVSIPAAPTNVGAYYKVEQGYMVSWSLPSVLTGITGYTVTASNGATCKVQSALQNQCTFSNSVVPNPMKPQTPYTFTVTANSSAGASAPSAPSNTVVSASAPGYPNPVIAKVISTTEIDLSWVPSTSTGGIPNYGYKVNQWEATLNSYGDPNNATYFTEVVPTTTAAMVNLKPNTWYVFDVGQCNALGCDNSDFVYALTKTTSGTPPKWNPPAQVNGGNAATVCWDAFVNAGTASTSSTVTVAPSKCAGITIDPSQYPKINPAATTLATPNLVNKFTDSLLVFGFSPSYSLATWQKLGLQLKPYIALTSASVMNGFTINPVVTSTTPSVCSITGTQVNFLGVGTCTFTVSVPANNIFLASNTQTVSLKVVA